MSDHELLRDVFRQMQKRHDELDIGRLNEIQAQGNQFGEIRDKDLLVRIGFSSQKFVDRCLSEHPGRHLWENVANVKRAFKVLRSSHLALIELAGSFHARITYEMPDEHSIEATLREATKAMYTYSCAASSLVQAYRHLVSQDGQLREKYELLKAEILKDRPLLEFFSQLRKANNHLHILVANPHYKISRHLADGTEEITSGLSFNRDQILHSSEWSAIARQFVSFRKELNVVALTDEHFRLASRFRGLVLVRSGVHSNVAYRDYGRILLARKTISKRVSLGLILQQAVPKRLNPYEYLDRCFTDAELQRIYSFRDHAKD